MNILSVITTMNPVSGGPAQGIRNNLPFWRKYGLNPTILSLDNPNEQFVVKESIIALGATNNKWAYSSKLIPWLLKNASKYDVILIHGLWLYNGYAVVSAIKQLRKIATKQKLNVPKVFIMPHGMLDPYFQTAKSRILKAIRNTIYWHLIEKQVINSANGVLFTCEEELQLAKTTFNGYSPKAAYNVGYGIIPPPIFYGEQKAAFLKKCIAVAGKPYLLFLSRIHPKKGIDILLEAYALCYQYCQNNNINLPDLVIAGPGLDTDYGLGLKSFQHQYPILEKKVHYSGMLQGDAKWGALYNAELFVLPSHQENFGIAIVEAMACKKPVLITNKVNIWREIEYGKGGFVIDDNLTSVLASLMEWVNLNISEKETMGNNAFNIYQSHFTAEATSKKFVEVIKKY